MNLMELFDERDINFKVENDSTRWSAKTELSNGDKLEVEAALLDSLVSGTMWDLAFSINDQYTNTGTGKEFEVLSAVMEALRMFCADKKPSALTMTASSRNKLKLYESIVRRYLKTWEIFVVTTTATHGTIYARKHGSKFKVRQNVDGFEILIPGEPGLTVKPDNHKVKIAFNPYLRNRPKLIPVVKNEIITIVKDLADGNDVEITDSTLAQVLHDNGVKL